MTEKVVHHGLITKVDGKVVKVRVDADKAECGACALSRLCTQGETIDAEMQGDAIPAVGRRATVECATSMQRLATLLYFGVPLGLLVAALATCSLLGVAEGWAALTAAAALALWYASLMLMRPMLNAKAKFKVTKIE